ncbi:PH domain-containing protein [Hyalangium gracile]|uniref:PH domain-containing protein n=1 Tax=Hyalangium gracile TaxID=394092 RepID=UPI001CCBF5E4|nr:PH domain-containing protein [Hyalangium gracile]
MGTLVCTVELDKVKGVTVKVENADDQITQTVVMDGTSITITVKGSEETSTIVQKQDSVVITCKDFTVDATGTLTLKSAKESSWASQDILKVESTKDMTFTSSAKLTQSATQDAKLSSNAKVAIEAATNLDMKGMQTSLTASGGENKIDGLTLKMSGKTQAELSSAMTKVSGQGQLGLESSGVAELKGSMTTVGGALVKLG